MHGIRGAVSGGAMGGLTDVGEEVAELVHGVGADG